MEPVNLVYAGLVAQISLVAILFLGGLLIRRNERHAGVWRQPAYGSVAWLSLLLALISTGALILTDAFEALSGPAFRGNLPNLLSWSLSLTLILFVDIIFIGLLTYLAGGRESPFRPFVFLVPTLAIFLEQSAEGVVVYASLATGTYLLAGNFKCNDTDVDRLRRARAVVTVLSMVVTVAVGLMTR